MCDIISGECCRYGSKIERNDVKFIDSNTDSRTDWKQKKRAKWATHLLHRTSSSHLTDTKPKSWNYSHRESWQNRRNEYVGWNASDTATKPEDENIYLVETVLELSYQGTGFPNSMNAWSMLNTKLRPKHTNKGNWTASTKENYAECKCCHMTTFWP